MKTVDDILKEKILKGGFTRNDLLEIARLHDFIVEVAEEFANQCNHRYVSVETNKCLKCNCEISKN